MYTALLVCAAAGLLVYRCLQVGKRGPALPPGPKTVPVLGNLLTIPPRYAHLYFHKLAKEYGDVVSLKVFGYDLVILNSATAMTDLIDKRSCRCLLRAS